MADASMSLEGDDELRSWFDRAKEGALAERAWWVGTIVVYAWYLEFGTRFMTAKTFFTPAIHRVANSIAGVSSGSVQVMPTLLSKDASVVRDLAFELERQVKAIITEKGLIVTSNLRSSIAAGPSVDEMIQASGQGIAAEGDPGALEGTGATARGPGSTTG